MRESLFVKQNSEKWKAYEQLHTDHPDVLAERFIDITNDLAYARTFYPDSKITGYLNGIASVLHQSIYKNKKETGNLFIRFWAMELPLLFYKYRRQMAYSFIFFLLFTLIGVFSARYNDSFVRMIMGDGYVNMTNENIAKGDPFGVYKKQGEIQMFLGIASNNILVTMILFISGVFFSIGPIFFIMRNAIMLGSFQYYFFSKGLGLASVLVIWIHGTLEISSIIIAGGAGLVLGQGMLFPKTYTRMQAFKNSAKDGTKIAFGVVPILIVAAFFEGFVTRHTGMPIWLSSSILLGSLFFIIWYVAIYPLKINRRLQSLRAY